MQLFVQLPECANFFDALLELLVLCIDLERNLFLVSLLRHLADRVAEGFKFVFPDGEYLLAVASDLFEISVVDSHQPLGPQDAQHLVAQISGDGFDELEVAVDRVVGILRSLQVNKDCLHHVGDLADFGCCEEIVDGKVFHHRFILGNNFFGLLESNGVGIERSSGMEALGLLQGVQCALYGGEKGNIELKKALDPEGEG